MAATTMTDKHHDMDIEHMQWAVVDAFYRENSLVKHQLDSYNDFILRKMEEIIEGFNPVQVYHHYVPELEMFQSILKVDIVNPVLSKPTIHEKDGSTKLMTPNDARLRNFTYAAPLTVDIKVTTETYNEQSQEYITEVKKLSNINLAKIPIMVRSKYCVLAANQDAIDNINECQYDVGGYFVINGNEKVVISQDRMCENKTYVFTNSKGSNAYSHIAEIRSVSENRFGVPKTTSLKLSAKPNQFGKPIRVNLHHIKQEVPLFIVFKALGIENDKAILEHIVNNVDDHANNAVVKELVASVDEASDITCSRDALEYLSKYLHINGYPKEIITNKQERLNILRSVLEKEFLPHVGPEVHKKAIYLGYMTKKLVSCYLGLWKLDDRDSYINKRVDSPGVLMANLFRQYFGKMVKDMRNMIQKEINNGAWKATGKFSNIINKLNVYKIIKSTVIESGMKYALATGNWGIKSNKNKQGVAQVLNRMTYNASLSHLRRVNTPLEKSGKLIQPRKLHSTQFGYICPSETPEGAAVGLVKNLAMAASISISSNSTNIRTILHEDEEMCFAEDNGGGVHDLQYKTKVIVNGDIIGTHDNPLRLYQRFKALKKRAAINIYTSIVWDVVRNEISINCEGGRMVRPLFTVANNRPLILDMPAMESVNATEFDWKHLVCNGYIEFLDVDETNASMIAMKPSDLSKGDKGANKMPKYTHLEIHPSLMLGVLAGSIPFSDHNQAPRNTYQCLHVDETVLMADGSYKKIKDVIVGDNVVTFDPATKETTTTTVVHQYVRPAANDVYVVTTISGRTITATSNHNFMTSSGWKPVEEFDNNTAVGVHMCLKDMYDTSDSDVVVIDCDSFRSRLNNVGFMIADVARMCNHFETSQVIPMKASSCHLMTLARICGYIRGAGVLDHNKVSIDFDNESDAKMFDEDVASVGIECVHPVKISSSDCMHNEGKPMPWRLTYKDFLPALLHVLGASSWVVPGWVVHGGNSIKREYLAGYQGACGKSIIYQDRPYFPMTALVTADQDRHSIVAAFVEEMKEMFECVGVAMHDTIKIHDDDLYVVGFKMVEDADNCKEYYERVGFRYSTSKLMQSGLVVEYIKHIHHQPLNHKTFAWWSENVHIQSTSLFVPIEGKMMVPRCMISDITVAHKNHSFIAGDGFLSSNSAMGKQAIGIYSTNFRHRFDTMAHVLNYSQKPLVQTKTSKLVHNDEMPCGVNIIVAIMCMTGFNQEDSIIMNQSAVDRGLFSSTYYKTYKEQNNRNHSNGEEEFFTRPTTDTTKGVKPFNYAKLSDTGFVPENTPVTAGDVIIGKCMPQKKDSGIIYKDTSVSLKNNECGYVDKNCYGDKYFTNINGDGYTFTKVRIRNMRVPTIGDKFSSKHGQKGTVGILYRQEDMPFSKNGLVPDIIINPHAIPSRMTIAQLMECLLSKSCVVKGEYGDATPFTNMSVENIAKELESNGLERYGNELLYNSRTGEQINTEIFIGPTFYQRLKHMTCDKVHSRGNAGPIVLLTRQPAEGRAREGGLRIGEMELDSCLGHSVMSFLKERFMESSDNYRVFVCRKCGMMANVNPEQNIYACKPCKNTSSFAEIRIPYAAKLLFQEMGTMSIATRFLV
jgi:DNA-directed RNA polymerase beta subunit